VNFETPDVEPGDYTTDYTALEALGVTVVSAFGIVDDDGENWGITGNSGSQFIGVNGNPSDTLRLEFDSVYTGISLGCAVSNGNSAGDTLRLTLFDGADAVFTRGYTMADVDAWQALFSYGQYEFDAVEVVSLNPGPFGCDNLELDATALPETGTGAGSLVFWAAGLLALGSLLVRRRARA
jgi:LPXTG-motif cell wall-anchored protein